ncbi:protein of unknown function [Rhodovastum atsumiense]|nr:protein of unknown function [Rhodovastum atsumiense]
MKERIAAHPAPCIEALPLLAHKSKAFRRYYNLRYNTYANRLDKYACLLSRDGALLECVITLFYIRNFAVRLHLPDDDLHYHPHYHSTVRISISPSRRLAANAVP